MSRVSVVVPAFDAASTLGDTLVALKAQTGLDAPLEIVVVDDGSGDATAEVARRHGVVLVQQANAGPGAARNAGVRAAGGELILFTDSDCIPQPSWASQMLAAFQDEAVGLVMGRTFTHRGGNWLARVQEGSDFVAREPGPVSRFNSNNLGLRAPLARATPFDEALRIYGEDSDLGWRILQTGHETLYWPAAELEHRHVHGLRSFFRDARRHGWGAARLHYKHGIWLPRDLAFGVLALASLVVAALAPPLRELASWAAGACGALFCAGLLWNELHYKGKSLGLALWTFPLQLAWYLAKLAGYLQMLGRIALGREPALRESKRRFAAERVRA